MSISLHGHVTMAKKQIPIIWGSYATIGRQVYLGKCSQMTRRHARAAGLIPITVRQMRKAIQGMQAVQRIMLMGEWHDTVKY